MARYRKVSIKIWHDKAFRSLNDDQQLLFLFILTHPNMTSVGGMAITLEGLAAQKGWRLDRLSKAVSILHRKRMIRYDPGTQCLILPNFIKHNEPESWKVIGGWVKAFELLPEGPLQIELYHILREYIETRSDKCQQMFEKISYMVCDTVSIPYRFQEPKPKPKQEQEQEPKPEPELEQDKQEKSDSPDISLNKTSDSDSTEARQLARMRYDGLILNYFGMNGDKRHGTQSKQYAADRTCARQWWDELIWPEGAAGAENWAKVREWLSQASEKTKPMAWLRSRVKTL